jgi:hypothetical protein
MHTRSQWEQASFSKRPLIMRSATSAGLIQLRFGVANPVHHLSRRPTLMKNNASQLLLCSALSCALAGSAAAQPHARRGVPPPGQPPTLAGVFTNHSGKIRQLNYGPEGEINGFLASNGALVHLPPGADLQLENLFELALQWPIRDTLTTPSAAELSWMPRR